jgi:hypothetical protein
VLLQVGGHRLHVVRVRLHPLVVGGRDAEAEHVDRLRLAAEAHGQLLRDEHVRPVGHLEHAGDRVVVGDRHEVHAAPLGERIHLLGRRGALGQPERTLDPELRDLGGTRVAVQVRATHGIENALQIARVREPGATAA